MGRPINQSFLKQLSLSSAWIPGAPAPSSFVQVLTQTGASSYQVTDGTYTGIVTLVNPADPAKFLTLISATPTAGTGYLHNDVLTVSGGVYNSVAGGYGTAATMTVSTIKLHSLAINAAGTVYVPNDLITLAGGTSTVAASVRVLTTKVVSATVHAAGGGTGYGTSQTFNVTVVGGTGTAAVINVTSNSSGVVTTVNSVTTAGSYSSNPTLSGVSTTSPTGGGSAGTGLLLDLVVGLNSVGIANAGVYTVGSTTFTQASTTGSGTGGTFNTGVFGINAVSIGKTGSYVDQGTYSQVPANPASVTGGTGTGGKFNLTWAIPVSIVGHAHLRVAANHTGPFQYAAVVQQDQVKTFQGNVYNWIISGTPTGNQVYLNA